MSRRLGLSARHRLPVPLRPPALRPIAPSRGPGSGLALQARWPLCRLRRQAVARRSLAARRQVRALAGGLRAQGSLRGRRRVAHAGSLRRRRPRTRALRRDVPGRRCGGCGATRASRRLATGARPSSRLRRRFTPRTRPSARTRSRLAGASRAADLARNGFRAAACFGLCFGLRSGHLLGSMRSAPLALHGTRRVRRLVVGARAIHDEQFSDRLHGRAVEAGADLRPSGHRVWRGRLRAPGS